MRNETAFGRAGCACRFTRRSPGNALFRPGLVAFFAILLSCAFPAAAELLPVPDPSLAGMDEVVRRQLADVRADLDALLEHPPEDRVSPEDRTELARAYGELGRLYLAYDLPAASEACLANAHRLETGNVLWPYLLGVLYQKDRRVDEAVASFEDVLRLDADDLATLIRLGDVHLDRAEPEKARSRFAEALALSGDGAAEGAARAGLGKALAALGQAEAAVVELEAALAKDPAASSLHYPLALAYRELGRIDDARRHLAERGPGEPSFPDPLLDAVRQLATGAGVHLIAGNRALGRGDVEAALDEYRLAVRANPRSAPAQEALATTLAGQGDVEGAIRHYTAGLEAEPDNFLLHHNLGTVLARSGQSERAVVHLRRALELVPGEPLVLYKLARNLARSGQLAEARKRYRELIASEPREGAASRGNDPYAAARFDLSEILYRAGRYGEAAELLRELVRRDPNRSWARLSLGVALQAAGNVLGAMGEFRAVLVIDSAQPEEREEAHVGLALALLATGHDAEARESLEEGLGALPRSGRLAHLLARVLAASPDASVRDGKRALELAMAVYRAESRPEHVETVAMALAELGRFDEAVEWQKRLISGQEAARDPGRLARIRERLALYERGEPCRAPWAAP